MTNFDYAVYAYCSVVALTLILVVMNIHAVMRNYVQDRNSPRLYSYLGTLVIVSSLMVVVANSVVDHVIESEMVLDAENYRPENLHWKRLH